MKKVLFLWASILSVTVFPVTSGANSWGEVTTNYMCQVDMDGVWGANYYEVNYRMTKRFAPDFSCGKSIAVQVDSVTPYVEGLRGNPVRVFPDSPKGTYQLLDPSNDYTCETKASLWFKTPIARYVLNMPTLEYTSTIFTTAVVTTFGSPQTVTARCWPAEVKY